MMSNNSTPSKIKAKLGFHGVLDSEVVKTLTVAYNGLLHNPAFPNTPSIWPSTKPVSTLSLRWLLTLKMAVRKPLKRKTSSASS